MQVNPSPSKRLTEEQRELAGKNWKLARTIAGRWSRRCPRFSADIESAAFIALCHAAIKFEPSRGSPFSSYAGLCIERGCKKATFSSRSSLIEAHATDEMMATDVFADPSIESNPEETLNAKEVRREVAELVDSLESERQKEVIRLRYMEGFTSTDISKFLGITKRSVLIAERLAIKNMREPFGRKESSPSLTIHKGGVDHRRSKFSREKIIDIRRSYAAKEGSQGSLAMAHGVSRGCIQGIVSGKNYSDVV